MDDEVPDLLESARSLSRMLQPGDLDATLAQVTQAAVKLLPEVDHASITVRRSDGRLETATATDGVARQLDAHQYALREGPCYDAATDAAQVVASDLATDGRYPTYGSAAVAAGIRSLAAYRLFEHKGAQGALNLYATQPGAFDRDDALTDLFQSEAAIAIAYARQVGNLSEALETRTTIGKAMGIVMERFELDDERAFAFLTRLSQHRNAKLRDVAEDLVTDAAQHHGDGAGIG
jgi:GAF domain-containing protein